MRGAAAHLHTHRKTTDSKDREEERRCDASITRDWQNPQQLLRQLQIPFPVKQQQQQQNRRTDWYTDSPCLVNASPPPNVILGRGVSHRHTNRETKERHRMRAKSLILLLTCFPSDSVVSASVSAFPPLISEKTRARESIL